MYNVWVSLYRIIWNSTGRDQIISNERQLIKWRVCPNILNKYISLRFCKNNSPVKTKMMRKNRNLTGFILFKTLKKSYAARSTIVIGVWDEVKRILHNNNFDRKWFHLKLNLKIFFPQDIISRGTGSQESKTNSPLLRSRSNSDSRIR